MADGLCDWQGCDSPHVQPAIVRLHPDENGRAPAAAEYRFELCPPHTASLMHSLQETPWHLPMDEGVEVPG